MMLITMSLASAFTMAGKGRQKFSRRLAFASGLLSLGFGLFVAYQICFVYGLFTSHARWIPQQDAFLRMDLLLPPASQRLVKLNERQTLVQLSLHQVEFR